MKKYYFLPDDFQDLETAIQKIHDRLTTFGLEIGESCLEGSETFHDNFVYEDNSRLMRMWSQKMEQLSDIRKYAVIIAPPPSTRVSMGRTVTIKDEEGKQQAMLIGSFMVFDRPDRISYSSPLAKILIGASAGDVRTGKISEDMRSFEIIDVE
jgi:transcription elongation GreA/GreB family factor